MRINIYNRAIMTLSLFIFLVVVSIACTETKTVEIEKIDTKEISGLTGTIEIDGSSTVYPITVAVAEEFRKIYPDIMPLVQVMQANPVPAVFLRLIKRDVGRVNQGLDILRVQRISSDPTA